MKLIGEKKRISIFLSNQFCSHNIFRVESNQAAQTLITIMGNTLGPSVMIGQEYFGIQETVVITYAYKQLAILPAEIGKFDAVKELCLHGNYLTSLPAEIGNMSSLETLDLDDNKLSSIPPEFGNLGTLKKLDLRNNRLTSLPAEIGNLITLEELYLGYNQLESLPAEIGNLCTLKHLSLCSLI